MNTKENQHAEVAEGQRERPTLENSSAFPGITVLQFVALITDRSLEEAGRKVHGNSLYYRLQLLVNLKLSKI